MTDVSFTGDDGASDGALFARWRHGDRRRGHLPDNGNGSLRRRGHVSRRRDRHADQHDHRQQRLGLEPRRRDRQRRRNPDAHQRHLLGQPPRRVETDNGRSTTVENTISALAFPTASTSPASLPARATTAGSTTSAAITNDRGNNIDQDGTCGLTERHDVSESDPTLAPICDNGGPTRTQALLPEARRSVTRPTGLPAHRSARHSPPRREVRHRRVRGGAARGAHGVAQATRRTSRIRARTCRRRSTSTARPEGSISSTAPSQASCRTARRGRGRRRFERLGETETLSGLNPDTTYYYQAAGDNATTSTPGATSNSSRPCPARRSSRTSTSTRSPTRPRPSTSRSTPRARTRVLPQVRTRPTSYSQQTPTVEPGPPRAHR